MLMLTFYLKLIEIQRTLLPRNMDDYIQQLTPKQQQAYAIAKRNLGSSFNLSLSIGFLDWKKEQEQSQVPSVLPSNPQLDGTSSNSPNN